MQYSTAMLLSNRKHRINAANQNIGMGGYHRLRYTISVKPNQPDSSWKK